MKTIKFRLTGVAPIMFHSEALANPRNPATIELKKLTGIRKKTDEIYQQIAEMEWRASLYTNNNREPCIPADNILAAIKEGARKRKLGKLVESGVFSEVESFPLEFDGPKDVDGLWADGRFFDYRCVGVNNARTMRARPRFNDWGAEIEITYDPDIISEDDLISCVQLAGQSVGLCEKRPQMGRFKAEVV